jgi:hypothetical protein
MLQPANSIGKSGNVWKPSEVPRRGEILSNKYWGLIGRWETVKQRLFGDFFENKTAYIDF